MDSFSDQVNFSFSNLRSTVSDPQEVLQVLLYIDASFVIEISGEKFFSEVDFPIVEFAEYAFRWTKCDKSDFNYVSMEAQEDPLIAFRVITPGYLVPYSPWQEFDCNTCVSAVALRTASITLAKRLQQAIQADMKYDISTILHCNATN